MTDQLFDSTDANRHARDLKHVQYARFPEPLRLEHGGMLPEVTVAYETYGQLNERRDNAVLVCHALSGDSHVAQHSPDDDPGWWDLLVGPGKMVDTDKYFVICPNALGGCRGTTGPDSINPTTGKRYGREFPLITIADIVEAQWRLVESLGIEQLLCVLGGSLGGLMTLQWASAHPDRLRGAAAIATSARLTSQALAFDIVSRNAISSDPKYHDGRYYDTDDAPGTGLAIARMLGHITYLSHASMRRKFERRRMQARDIATEFETKFAVGSYLAYQGDKFVERFDANSYMTLSMAMDMFDLGDTRQQLAKAFGGSTCRWMMISYSSDWLFPSFQSREVVDTLLSEGKSVSYCCVQSDCGHDAFLLPDDIETYGRMVEAFLANLSTTDSTDMPPSAGEEPWAKLKPRRQRLDYDRIAELIPTGSSVLDLGCGSGGLLDKLRRRGDGPLQGIEIDESTIVRCVQRGLDVVQADLNDGLRAFQDGQFDFVLLSKTLQTVTDVEFILDEMLRVGKRAIVSFPNIGYHKFREQLAAGTVPTIDADAGYRWYNTPNVRYLSIADFESFCGDKGFQIHEVVGMDTEQGCVVGEDPNRNADVAIVVLSR